MSTQNEAGASMSARGWSNVQDIMPQIRAAVKERERQHSKQLVEQPSKRSRSPATQQIQVEIEDSQDKDIPIDLSTAENWLVRDDMLRLCQEAIANGLERKHLSYPGGLAGDPDLLKSLATFLNVNFLPRTPVTEEHLAVAPGAAGCLDALIYNICDAGEGILVPAPCWNAFDFILRARTTIRILPVIVQDLEGCLTTALLDALPEALANAECKVKALLLVNPNNPLGRCYPKEVLEGCIKFCEERNIYFISDEIYALTSFRASDLPEPVPFTSALSLDVASLSCDPSRVHVVWSTSKDLGHNGLRMGCLVSQNNEHIRTGAALYATTTVSSLTACAVAHTLRSPELRSLTQKNSERLSVGYEMLTGMLREHGITYIPANAGLYVFVRIAPKAKHWKDEAKAVEKLKQAGVLVSSGRGYHTSDSSKGWARIGFAIPKDMLSVAIERMRRVFSPMKTETQE